MQQADRQAAPQRAVIRKGRRSDPVPTGYRRPATVSADGLVVRPRGDSGEPLGAYDFSAFRVGPELRSALAAAFDAHCGAHGTAKSAGTCLGIWRNLRALADWLGDRDTVPQHASDLTPALWKQWHLQAAHNAKTTLRPVLRAVPGLPANTARSMNATVFGTSPPPEHEQELTGADIDRIRAALRQVWRQAHERTTSNALLLADWRAGAVDERTDRWHVGCLLDAVARTGRMTPDDWAGLPQASREAYARAVGHTSKKHPPAVSLLSARLYLTTYETVAAVLLLVIEGDPGEGGYNRGVIDSMETTAARPDAGAGGTVIRTVSIDKPRRGASAARSSESLADRGNGSYGRLYAEIEEATQPARDTLAANGIHTRRLLVHRPMSGSASTCGLKIGAPSNGGDTWPRWAAEMGLLDSQGLPMTLSPQSLRRAVVARAAVPRQHSRGVHDNSYALRDARTNRTHDHVIEAGLQDAHDHARRTVGLTWLSLGTSQAARVAETLGISADEARELLGGDRDTAVGACRDHLAGPFAPQGEPCPASYLSCFACGNAVATPSHLPRLVYLADALDTIRRSAAPAFWQAHYADPAARLADLLERNTTEPERNAARGRLEPEHKARIDDLLARRWDA